MTPKYAWNNAHNFDVEIVIYDGLHNNFHKILNKVLTEYKNSAIFIKNKRKTFRVQHAMRNNKSDGVNFKILFV